MQNLIPQISQGMGRSYFLGRVVLEIISQIWTVANRSHVLVPYFPEYSVHLRCAILGPKSQVRTMLRIWNACTSMKIEVRTSNEDWGCALYKGAHYTPKNMVCRWQKNYPYAHNTSNFTSTPPPPPVIVTSSSESDQGGEVQSTSLCISPHIRCTLSSNMYVYRHCWQPYARVSANLSIC